MSAEKPTNTRTTTDLAQFTYHCPPLLLLLASLTNPDSTTNYSLLVLHVSHNTPEATTLLQQTLHLNRVRLTDEQHKRPNTERITASLYKEQNTTQWIRKLS